MQEGSKRQGTMPKSGMAAKRVALGGLLTALMLVLGYIESQIPVGVGIPGIKLGLSNAVLIYGVYLLTPCTTVSLMVLKVVLSALLFGSPFALAFSLAGGVCSLLGMLLMRRYTSFGILATSVVGALLHNTGQVTVAALIGGNASIFYYMTVLALAGIGTGVVTGIVAGLVLRSGIGKAFATISK